MLKKRLTAPGFEKVRLVAVGKHLVPLWMLLVVIGSMAVAVVAVYTTLNFTFPFQVKEPLEILSYPSQLSLFPGDTVHFNVTLNNIASTTYSVFFDFSLENTTYQHDYVAFSNATYSVPNGESVLAAWVIVSSDAPPTNAALTVSVNRILNAESYNIVSVSFTGTTNATNNAIVIRVQNTGITSFVITVSAKVNAITKPLAAEVSIAAGSTSNVTIPNVQWIEGRTYNIELVTTHGTKITYIATAPQT